MTAYLDDHPNRTLDQQRPRRDKPSGLIVVHTAESALDVTGGDDGAESVARYISVRDTYGSYHRIADSDSVVPVARFEMATYGDGTGSNDFAIHVSFACRAADWPAMSAERRAAFIRNGAQAATEAARWLEREHGITVPARRITRAESDRRVPGFISHGDRDPGRRTDPGPAFPWDHFLNTYADLMEDDMFNDDDRKLLQEIREAQRTERKRDQERMARLGVRLKALSIELANASDASAEKSDLGPIHSKLNAILDELADDKPA